MNLARFASAPDFRARAEPFLVEREVYHNLILGLAAALTVNPNLYPSQPYFAVVEEAGNVVAAAVMTPPHRLVLSLNDSREALTLIARDVREFRPDTPGVVAPVPVGLHFAEIWRDLTGQPFHKGMAERLYKLEKVRHPSGVSGQMRRAAESDRALLLEWVRAFQLEALGEADDSDVERVVHNMVTLPPDYRGVYLWEDPSRSRLSPTAAPRRTACALARCTRLQSFGAGATPARALPPSANTCSTPGASSAPFSPTSPTRPRTRFISRSVTSQWAMWTSINLIEKRSCQSSLLRSPPAWRFGVSPWHSLGWRLGWAAAGRRRLFRQLRRLSAQR